MGVNLYDLCANQELKAYLSYHRAISPANINTLFLLLYFLHRLLCNQLNACKEHVNGPEWPSNALFKEPFDKCWRVTEC